MSVLAGQNATRWASPFCACYAAGQYHARACEHAYLFAPEINNNDDNDVHILVYFWPSRASMIRYVVPAPPREDRKSHWDTFAVTVSIQDVLELQACTPCKHVLQV